MIGRYTRPEMGAIWELQNKFEIWKEIEVLACEAQAELANQVLPKKKQRGFANMQTSRLSALMKLKK